MSIRSWSARARAIFRRRRIDAELGAEIEAHLRLAEDAYVARGLSRDAARDAARREFGSTALAREASREEWGWPALDSYAADMRFGARLFRKHWMSTSVAAITLGLGIGATTGVVSTLDAVRNHRFAFADPDRLAILWAKSLRNPQYDEMQVSLPEVRDWQSHASTVRVAAFSWTESINVAVGGSVERLRASRVTPNLLPVLGARPSLGRWFEPDDEIPSAGNAAVVSYSYWHDRLGASDSALRSTITIDRHPYAIVGVLPRDFELPLLGDVPVLLTTRGARWSADAASRSMVAIGRLRRGATVKAASAELDALSRNFARQGGAATDAWSVNADPLSTVGRADSTRTLAVMLALAWLVLLAACANVAILLLARIPAREQELAIRLALGAGERRILRQLLLESTLIAASAAGIGLLVARPTNALLVRILSDALPFTIHPSLTGIAVAGATLSGVLTCLLFGVAPALSGIRRAGTATLGRTSRQAGTRVPASFRAAMLGAEAAMAVLLLVGGWLMIESVRRMHATELGFDPRQLVTARLSLDAARYPAAAAQIAFYDALRARLEARPDLRDVTLASSVPLAAAGELANGVTRPPDAGERIDTVTAGAFIVMPSFFAAMKTPLVDGTTFEPSNAHDGVIVNEALARRLWPGRRAVGEQLDIGAAMFDDGQTAPPGPRRVIGVARTVPLSLLRTAAARNYPMFYLPASEVPVHAMFVVARAETPAVAARAIREEVRALDPLLPVFTVRTSDDLLAYWYGPIQTDALVAGVLAATGVLLTVVGIYSVVSVFVSQRRREIGIRIAVGARTADVLALVLRRTLEPTLVGAAIGMAAAIATSRWAASLFYDTSPLEPRAFIGALLTLGGVVALAAVIPARRACVIDPREALVQE